MFNDSVTMRGHVKIVCYHADGRVTRRDIHNLVVATGKSFIASRMVGTTPPVMSHMAVGTDSTAPAGTDTTLKAEVGSSRTALANSGAAGPVATYNCTFGPGVGTGALQEAGIFNDPAAGVMLARVTYPVVNKGAADTMAVTWTVTVT